MLANPAALRYDRGDHFEDNEGYDMIYALYTLVVLVLIGCDQLLKSWTVSHLELGQSTGSLPGFLQLTRVHNYGAAWSSFSGKTVLLVAVTAVLLVAVLFLLGFLIGRGHTGGGDDEEYDDEPPRTPAKPLIPEERHSARVPRLVPREESSDSEPAAIPDKTPAAPMTPAAPAEEPVTAERSAQDEPTQAAEDEVRTMSLDDLLDDIHNKK